MSRYICTECGAIFDEPHEYEERHGFTSGPFEKWSVCPECKEPGYEEASNCDICGKVIPMSEYDSNRITGHDGAVYHTCNDCEVQ